MGIEASIPAPIITLRYVYTCHRTVGRQRINDVISICVYRAAADVNTKLIFLILCQLLSSDPSQVVLLLLTNRNSLLLL